MHNLNLNVHKFTITRILAKDGGLKRKKIDEILL